eukprot:1559508-Rhodomonas_salina.1
MAAAPSLHARPSPSLVPDMAEAGCQSRCSAGLARAAGGAGRTEATASGPRTCRRSLELEGAAVATGPP